MIATKRTFAEIVESEAEDNASKLREKGCLAAQMACVALTSSGRVLAATLSATYFKAAHVVERTLQPHGINDFNGGLEDYFQWRKFGKAI